MTTVKLMLLRVYCPFKVPEGAGFSFGEPTDREPKGIAPHVPEQDRTSDLLQMSCGAQAVPVKRTKRLEDSRLPSSQAGVCDLFRYVLLALDRG